MLEFAKGVLLVGMPIMVILWLIGGGYWISIIGAAIIVIAGVLSMKDG